MTEEGCHSFGLLFGGGPGQWARYARWAGAASSGELSFSLRTNATRALLLYLDDGGDCDFLELLLVDGRLRLRFTLSCAEPATLQLDTPAADDRWHMVLLTRDARRTALAVDGEVRSAEVRSKRREMQVASDLFVGGIPPDVRLSALTLSTVKYEPPFRGLLANLKLGERPPALLGSQGLRGAAADPLCAPARNPCANGGLCTVLAPGEVGCDCSHTGFGGKFCSEGEPGGAAAGRRVPGSWPGGVRTSTRGSRGAGEDARWGQGAPGQPVTCVVRPVRDALGVAPCGLALRGWPEGEGRALAVLRVG
uniref:Neurexin 2 n=1 Tax=Canis lupus dingo TaxID=286419 RepID=A0A8C0KNY8_CANLU